MNKFFILIALIVFHSDFAFARDYLEINRDRATLNLIDKDSLVYVNNGEVGYVSHMLFGKREGLFVDSFWISSKNSINCQTGITSSYGIFAETYGDGSLSEFIPTKPRYHKVDLYNNSVNSKTFMVLCKERPVNILYDSLENIMRTYQVQTRSGMIDGG